MPRREDREMKSPPPPPPPPPGPARWKLIVGPSRSWNTTGTRKGKVKQGKENTYLLGTHPTYTSTSATSSSGRSGPPPALRSGKFLGTRRLGSKLHVRRKRGRTAYAAAHFASLATYLPRHAPCKDLDALRRWLARITDGSHSLRATARRAAPGKRRRSHA